MAPAHPSPAATGLLVALGSWFLLHRCCTFAGERQDLPARSSPPRSLAAPPAGAHLPHRSVCRHSAAGCEAPESPCSLFRPRGPLSLRVRLTSFASLFSLGLCLVVCWASCLKTCRNHLRPRTCFPRGFLWSVWVPAGPEVRPSVKLVSLQSCGHPTTCSPAAERRLHCGLHYLASAALRIPAPSPAGPWRPLLAGPGLALSPEPSRDVRPTARPSACPRGGACL